MREDRQICPENIRFASRGLLSNENGDPEGQIFYPTLTRIIARWLKAKFKPDCAIPDTGMKFGTVVDHD